MDTTELTTKDKDQESFSASICNKVGFIDMLKYHLQANGHIVKQGKSDADTFIVSTALNYAKKNLKDCWGGA